MNIWILTIGSSDVQLKTKANWTTHFRKVRDQLDDRGFSPWDGKEGRFGVQSRVLGAVYSHPDAEQSFNDLVFPLVDNFIAKISKKSIKIDKIILILSDQSIFDRSDRRIPDHAYWKDTCTLQPLLEKYLKQELEDILPNLQFQDPPLILKAKSKAEGLDNWNSVLDLVKERFGSIQSDSGEVYVSHQAGTPAISSAVQFCSLAKFGDRVRFLVSNEDKSELTGFVESSNYLRGIKREQAKELLENYDYAGVNKLIREYLLNEDTKILLDAGIQWNFAKFEEFADKLLQLTNPELQELVQSVSDRRQYYWWTAYEAAYLATVRHSQKNMVEALFHSFRAVEGLICEWAIVKYKPYIYYDEKGSPQISEKVKEVIPEYWEKMMKKNQNWLDNLAEQNRNREAKGKKPNPVGVGLFSQNLYLLWEQIKPELKKDPYLKKGLYSAKETRNQQFHRLLGLQEDNLKIAWDVGSIPEWQETVIGCLNAIAKDDLPENLNFRLPKDASLMAIVHQELEKAIDNL